MLMVEFVGWIGTFLLSCCGIPQIIASFKDDSAVKGLDYSYLASWICGVACMAVYIHYTPHDKYPYPLQIANLISFSCAMILMVRKFIKQR